MKGEVGTSMQGVGCTSTGKRWGYRETSRGITAKYNYRKVMKQQREEARARRCQEHPEDCIVR